MIHQTAYTFNASQFLRDLKAHIAPNGEVRLNVLRDRANIIVEEASSEILEAV